MQYYTCHCLRMSCAEHRLNVTTVSYNESVWKQLGHYLLGQPFEHWTDHEPLTSWLGTRVIRFLQCLSNQLDDRTLPLSFPNDMYCCMPALVTAAESMFMLGSHHLDTACVGVMTTFVEDNSVLQSPLQLLSGRSTQYGDTIHCGHSLSALCGDAMHLGQPLIEPAPGATTDRASTWGNH